MYNNIANLNNAAFILANTVKTVVKAKRVKKYLETRDTSKREVVVIKSESAKLAYIATNVQYTHLASNETLLSMLKVAVEARAKFANLAMQQDLVATVEFEVAHSLEQDAKAKAHDSLTDAGYVVLSTRGKGVAARIVEDVKESTETTDTTTETA